MNRSEEYSLRFYQWEYPRGRGYMHFPVKVEIEPPFVPFYHALDTNTKRDDGRVPSLFEQVKGLLISEKSKKEEPEEKIEAYKDSSQSKLVAIKIIIRKEFKVSQSDAIEFLNILSGCKKTVSYELHAKGKQIEIKIICDTRDKERILTQGKAYFTAVDFIQEDAFLFPFESGLPLAICDFGLEQEFMRPIQQLKDASNDPLFNVLATLKNLHSDDAVIFQCIFKGVENPWAQSIINSVHTPFGNPFFADAPEMTSLAEQKVSNVLFATVIRLVVQSPSENRIRYLSDELINNVIYGSQSGSNRLIPLSNVGYSFEDHYSNVINRSTNRLGMILNSDELACFAHLPEFSLLSGTQQLRKTKEVPASLGSGKYKLGLNEYLNQKKSVFQSDTIRLRHTHIIGATGTGKTTLLSNLISDDIYSGNGLLVLDPHGDLIEHDILPYIPDSRKDDVILIDPSNLDFSIGLNLLQARSEHEKLVLSSDLVNAFKSQSTAWGDNMTAVLSNAINAFLECSETGTLFDLKRFLIEKDFRRKKLKQVKDPTTVYFFNQEYEALRKGITPLLTRIDTFLRPKPIRSMFIQPSGIDFRKCMDENKIILVKLSQGLVGKENSQLLGSIILSKINQAALSRQDSSQRPPFYVYLDEFHNVITPSISEILEGSRKYGLGLILAHQQLSQIKSQEIQESVLTNCFTQICFRLGNSDANRLAHSYSGFITEDFMNLNTGEAIAKVGRSLDDFSLETELPQRLANFEASKYIKENSGLKFGLPFAEIDRLILESLPLIETEKSVTKISEEIHPVPKSKAETKANSAETISEHQRKQLVQMEVDSQKIREHNRIQTQVKKLAQEKGFMSIVEKETNDGGRIDVYLEREELSIGVEISVTNKPEYELSNIKKCLAFDCHPVWMISNSIEHLNAIKLLCENKLKSEELAEVHFGTFDAFKEYLLSLNTPQRQPEVEMVNGIRIKTEYDPEVSGDSAHIKERLIKLLYRK